MTGRPVVAVQLVGDHILRAHLRHAYDELEDLKEAQAAAAHSVIPVARQRAPKVTGALAASLVANQAMPEGPGAMGSFLPYAARVHWGDARHGIRRNTFLLDAARATEGKWLRYFFKEADEALDEASTRRPK